MVGEYEHVEDKSAEGILIRVFTPIGKKDQVTSLALLKNISVKFYSTLEFDQSHQSRDLFKLGDWSDFSIE